MSGHRISSPSSWGAASPSRPGSSRPGVPPAGAFNGPLVVTMRPIPAPLVPRAVQISGRFPAVHGAPVHVGDPAALGIRDLGKPEFGDAVTIRPGEVPVFWACGVTPQAVAMQAKPPLMITRALARRCDVRTKYASHLASRAALHPDLFEQPGQKQVFQHPASPDQKTQPPVPTAAAVGAPRTPRTAPAISWLVWGPP